MTEFAPGQVIADRYRVVEKLGAGGMGAVYLVEELSSAHRFALKTLLTQGANDKSYKRFELEAKATRLLQHDNLVKMYDFGLTSDNQPFFVMDYCQGDVLADLIERGPIAVDEAIEIFITLCNALTYAHAQGVIHRDLKPSNVMLTPHGVKILDFGIAKVLNDDPEFNTLTQTGEIFGSPLYMSPEQCLGKSVDLRSDVYSMGCMFFESLTGSPPFVGETAMATMLKHQSQAPPSLKEATLGGDFKSDLQAVVSRMIEKNPENRYQDLLRVADDLKHVLNGEPLVSLSEKKEKNGFNKIIVGVIALLVLLLGSAAASKFVQNEKTYKTHTSFDVERGDVPKHFEVVQQEIVPADLFYSILPANGKTYKTGFRDFQFPPKAIGYIGYEDDFRRFTPACAFKENVRVPFRLLIKQSPVGIPHFRKDEVSWLRFRGILADDQTTEGLRGWSELEELDMNTTNLTDASIESFKQLPKLISLNIGNTNISAAGLQRLELERMKGLGIDRIRDAKSLLPRLAESGRLERLSMMECKLSDEDLKLISRLTKLERLDLKHNSFTDRGVKNLSRLVRLTDLALDGDRISARSVETFSKLPRLKNLSVMRCRWTDNECQQFTKVLKGKLPELKIGLHPGE